MAIDPANFFRQAKQWFESESAPDEVSIRSIISRAYYAAFLEARDRAGLTNAVHEVHAKTIEYYSNQRGILYAIGRRLAAMKANRVRADYKLKDGFIKRNAESALVEARRVLKDLGVPDGDLDAPPTAPHSTTPAPPPPSA